MKPPKINLLLQILIAIALGVGCAYIFPTWLERLFITFNAIFSQFLSFLIPLIILGFVAPAISEIGRGAGKVLLATVAIAYTATTLSGLMSFYVGDTLFPSLVSPGRLGDIPEDAGLQPYFTIDIPPLMSVMTALVAAFVTGICLAGIKGDVLKRGFSEFREIVETTIRNVIIPLLPLYIFGIFLNMTVSGQVATVMASFVKIIGVIFAMHILLLVVQYCIAGLVSGKNPFRLLATMLPAYFTALGTQSSAATIPVTLRQSVKTGVSEEIAGFVVPLCATIHMSGSAMKIVACAIALMLMQGIDYDAASVVGFCCMLGISIVAAPGVPGGAIMASLGLLSSMLGFSEADQALMIALYIAMDSFGTACNVTGDGFIALVVDRLFGRRHAGVMPAGVAVTDGSTEPRAVSCEQENM